MQRYNEYINIFPNRVILRTRYNEAPLKPHTISRDAIVRAQGYADAPSRLIGRSRKHKNQVRFVQRTASRSGIDLDTNTLMVDSFYAFVPGFASHVVHIDGDESNNNIDNLLPLFGVQEEREYYIDLLAQQENCRVTPATNVYLTDDLNLDNFLITDDGRLYSIKTRQWVRPRMGNGYLQVRLRIPSLVDSEITMERTFGIHRLVCRAFNGPPYDDSIIVNHIDNNHLNNNSSNLRWVTAAESQQLRRLQPP